MRRVLVLLTAVLASSALLLAVDEPSNEPVAAKPCGPRHKPPCSTTTTRPAATTTTTRPAATTIPPTAPAGHITRVGRELRLNGQPYRFTGFNAYSLAAWYSSNNGCGMQVDDIDGFMRSLRPNALVRFWAFENMGTNRFNGTRDWTGLDRVFRAAEAAGVRLIPVAGNNWDACDTGGFKNEAWFRSGYRTRYLPWLRELVTRYRNSPALGMWEALNEPSINEGCPADARDIVRSFLDTTANAIKAIDPNHLVSSGVLGLGNCGLVGADWQYGHAGSIDVTSHHDYGADSTPMPSDPNNGLRRRIGQAATLNKPLLIGETGIIAGPNGGCVTREQRVQMIRAKMDAQFPAGVDGVLAWNWQQAYWDQGCHHDFPSSDPLFTLMNTYTPAGGAPPPTPTTTAPATTTTQPPAAGEFLESFDGMVPATPAPGVLPGWRFEVDERDTQSPAIPAHEAQHGPDCSPPPDEHTVDHESEVVFICGEHLMTAMNGPAFGAAVLTLPVKMDLSQGTAVFEFDVSTQVRSTRDWWEFFITPDEYPPGTMPIDFQGHAGDQSKIFAPQNAVVVAVNPVGTGFESNGPFVTVHRNRVRGPFLGNDRSIENVLASAGLTTSATRRDTFRLELSRTHVKFCMPDYGHCWVDRDIPDLGWSVGNVIVGQYSYDPLKDTTNVIQPPHQNTWHWDNIRVAPAIPR